MDIKEFSRRMVELMPQLIRDFARHEHNYLSRGEITLPQLWALEYLSRSQGCLMSELAVSFKISRPAATGLIDRLISQGLVQRQGVKDDRRVVKVVITPKGKKIVSNIWEQKRRTLIRVFSQISATDRRQYLLTLERVLHILSTDAKKNFQSKRNP